MNDKNYTENLTTNIDSNEIPDTTKKMIFKHVALLNSTIIQMIAQPSEEIRIFYNLVSSRLVTDEQLKQQATVYNLAYAATALTQISSICALRSYNKKINMEEYEHINHLETCSRKMTIGLYDLFTFTRSDFIHHFNDLVQCHNNLAGYDIGIDEIPANTDADKHHLSYLLLKLLNRILKQFNADFKFEVYDVYGAMVGLREIFGNRSLRELVDTYGVYLADGSDFKNVNLSNDTKIRGANSQTNMIDSDQWSDKETN